jgi:hypothetical protein
VAKKIITERAKIRNLREEPVETGRTAFGKSKLTNDWNCFYNEPESSLNLSQVTSSRLCLAERLCFCIPAKLRQPGEVHPAPPACARHEDRTLNSGILRARRSDVTDSG